MTELNSQSTPLLPHNHKWPRLAFVICDVCHEVKVLPLAAWISAQEQLQVEGALLDDLPVWWHGPVDIAPDHPLYYLRDEVDPNRERQS